MSRRIGIAALIWGVSVLASRVVGILREAVIGRVLGGGGEADVYWTAFRLPDFLNYLLAGGALSLVFIPIFAGYLSKDDEAGGWKAFSVIANFLVLALALLTPLLWVATPWIAEVIIAPGFDEEQLALLTRLIRIMLPAQLFHLVGGMFSAVLQAKDKHTLPAMAALGYTGTIVVLGLALGHQIGAEAFAWGVLLGSILGPFGLPFVGCLREGIGWRPTLSLRHPDFKQYFLLSLPIMLGLSIIVVDDWLLSRYGSLVSEGTVARLTYGKTLMKVPMGIFGLATASAAFPTLARLVAAGDKAGAYKTLVNATRMMLVLAFAAQAAFTVAGTEIATVIWGTTRFTPQELQDIGLNTGLFCLALGAWSAANLMARGFYAAQNTWTPTIIGTVVMLLAWPAYILLGENLGGPGLALASSLAVTLYVLVLGFVLRRLYAGPDAPGILGLVLRMLPAVGLSVAAGLGLSTLMDLPALVQGALCGGLALVLTLALARLFGVPEVSVVVNLVWGKLRRRLPLGAR